MRTGKFVGSTKTRRSACSGEAKALDSRRLPASIQEVTRYVAVVVQCVLWGKAAGRCEFAGCNQVLWKSPVTQEPVNIAQKAHIYSFSGSGPRGNSGISSDVLNSIENLMLVCHGCHRKMDQDRDGKRYSVRLLRQMKADHEQRIELVSGICPERSSHVLLFGANIGEHSSPLNIREAAVALFPHRYPASSQPIELSTLNSSFSERDTDFWLMEAENLCRKFDRQIRERLATGDVKHLSIFSLAPQPLLILLGTLLGDIVPVDVYQRHREPQSWEWPIVESVPAFELRPPACAGGTPALVLALSATIAEERITPLLEKDASIWTVTVPAPHNDMTKSRGQLSQFRTLLRSVLDRIKAAHGQETVLHVFPAMSVSLAIELGRVRMPKAEMPWRIYDQVNALGGFVPALAVPYGEQRQ
jgi:hypothetical protein